MENPVIIGKVVGVFGLKGILKIWPDTDFPQRFDEGQTVFIDGTAYKILETRWHKQQVRIRVEGITKIDQGEALIGNDVAVPSDDTPELQEDEYMVADLLGLEVFDEGGKHLGTLEDVHRGAQDLYQVGSTLIPAVKEFVLEVDIAGKRMVVRPIQGMFDDAD
ncbi:MAG: ribosome maturation factor RimM [Armatimonadota bacterium]|nr:ribosome maturation factor RimM [Armatimonadota bacterium]